MTNLTIGMGHNEAWRNTGTNTQNHSSFPPHNTTTFSGNGLFNDSPNSSGNRNTPTCFRCGEQGHMRHAVASIWLSQLMHSVLLVPSKVVMFFIICLLVSSLLLFTMWVRMWVNCVITSVTLAVDAGDMLFAAGVCMVVLVVGWFVSW